MLGSEAGVDDDDDKCIELLLSLIARGDELGEVPKLLRLMIELLANVFGEQDPSPVLVSSKDILLRPACIMEFIGEIGSVSSITGLGGRIIERAMR